MVTFRFYVVSAVVFFLALAVGMVIGSALDVGDPDRIAQGLTDMESKLDETLSLIDEKNQRIDELERYETDSAPFAGNEALAGTSSVVVVEPGLDTAAIEDLTIRLTEAGSNQLGYVLLDERWLLDNPDDLDAMETLTETRGSAEVVRASVVASMWGIEEGADPQLNIEFVRELQSAGLVELVGFDNPAEDGETATVVAVTGFNSLLGSEGLAAPSTASALSEAGVPVVLAEILSTAEDAPERGTLVRAAVENSEGGFSTVDNLDVVAGRVATVLALQETIGSVVGHYGFGPGANAVLPRWPIQ